MTEIQVWEGDGLSPEERALIEAAKDIESLPLPLQRKLKMKWSVETQQEFVGDFNMDLTAELERAVVEDMKKDIANFPRDYDS